MFSTAAVSYAALYPAQRARGNEAQRATLAVLITRIAMFQIHLYNKEETEITKSDFGFFGCGG